VTNQPILLSFKLENASVDEVQRELALKVLEQVHGNKSRAAAILKVSRPRLNRILKSGGINR
jgi:DNA-binding NtrC family response regulator